jgi:hypothetical protein
LAYDLLDNRNRVRDPVFRPYLCAQCSGTLPHPLGKLKSRCVVTRQLPCRHVVVLTSLVTAYDRVYNTLISARTKRITMDDIDNHTPYMPPPTTTRGFVVQGLPPCTIALAVDGTWHISTQLVAEEQDALATAAPSPDALCQRAQHALGLAGIGSRIAPDRNAIGVYLPASPAPYGTTPLLLEGRPLLWVVSRATSFKVIPEPWLT